MNFVKKSIFVLFTLTIFTIPSFSQKKIVNTKRVNPHAPVIDGQFNDEAWQSIEWESGFVQREPFEGKEPSQSTSFKILYDDKNVYCAIRAHDTEADKIVRRITRKDNMDGDLVGVQIDSYFDHLTAFTFLVTAGGVKVDGIFTNDGDNEDFTPDPVWHAKTSIDDGGWNAEMQIPLSQLRYGQKDEHVWGLQVARYLFRKEELSCWQHIPKDASGWVHLFGELHGITGIKSSRRIEILPYSVGKLETKEEEVGNPFQTGRLTGANIGLDGKIGLTSDLTMDFTINPDFGQVEADPSVVNLTAFETYYQEKRPFFIEGKNIFDFRIMMGDGDQSNDNLFYSRRIGKRPSHYPDTDNDEYVKMPDNSTIYGAMKISGKTRNGWSIGIMDAVTDKENATIDLNGERRYEVVEPMTNYFLSRIQKDFNKGATTVGGILTNTYRDIKDNHLNFLNKSAFTGGIDINHQWKDRTYYLTFNTVFSRISGDKEAMLEAQTSSRRYYQRPDADYVTLDSSRTSLSGYGGSLFFGKSGNGHVNFAVGGTWRSPGLELNDMGYMREADMILQFVWVGLRWWEPFSIFRSVNINLNQWNAWNFGGETTVNGGNVNMHMQFRNYWSGGGGIGYNSETLSTSTLRGGPAILLPSRWNMWLHLGTDSKKTFQFNIFGHRSWRPDNGSYSYSMNPSITWRPNDALSLSLRPFYNVNKSELQYIDTIKNGDDKYFFGRIDQETTGLVLRLNYSITPTLSIQYYGQPFVSAGKYSKIKRITDPRNKSYKSRFHQYENGEISYDDSDEVYTIDEDRNGSVEYELDNPDFNFREFRSNLVIRWEYSPGSTLFVVWSQSRNEYVSDGHFSFRQDMGDLFDVYPHNVFLVKFNRWFSL